MTRKDRLERMADRCGRLDERQAAAAWFRLAALLDDLSGPERRTPKFADLLIAILQGWATGHRAAKICDGSDRSDRSDRR